MRIALHTVSSPSEKEPLTEMAARVRKAFLDTRLGEPSDYSTLKAIAAGPSPAMVL